MSFSEFFLLQYGRMLTLCPSVHMGPQNKGWENHWPTAHKDTIVSLLVAEQTETSLVAHNDDY